MFKSSILWPVSSPLLLSSQDLSWSKESCCEPLDFWLGVDWRFLEEATPLFDCFCLASFFVVADGDLDFADWIFSNYLPLFTIPLFGDLSFGDLDLEFATLLAAEESLFLSNFPFFFLRLFSTFSITGTFLLFITTLFYIVFVSFSSSST